MYNKKAMQNLKKMILKEYPNLIEKIILFGSRVENKENEYSDYDILLIIKEEYDWKLKQKIRNSIFDINLDYDIITDTKLISTNELNSTRGRLPYVQDALLKGLVI